jgi:hypothetical protein
MSPEELVWPFNRPNWEDYTLSNTHLMILACCSICGMAFIMYEVASLFEHG